MERDHIVAWIVWKIRSLFWKHDFKKEEVSCTARYSYDPSTVAETGVLVSLTCKKCEFHTTYEKY